MVRGTDLKLGVNVDEKGVNKLRRELQKRINQVNKKEKVATEDAAEYAALAAQSVAPVFEQYLIKSIDYRVEDKKRAVVYVDENIIKQNPTAKSEGNDFNYAYYIHEIDSDYPVKIKSGEPRFLAFGAEEGRKFVREKLRRSSSVNYSFN